MKYLVQRYSPNKSLSMVASGFYTMFTADTKADAEYQMQQFKKVANELTVFRVISSRDFKKELVSQ